MQDESATAQYTANFEKPQKTGRFTHLKRPAFIGLFTMGMALKQTESEWNN